MYSFSPKELHELWRVQDHSKKYLTIKDFTFLTVCPFKVLLFLSSIMPTLSIKEPSSNSKQKNYDVMMFTQ